MTALARRLFTARRGAREWWGLLVVAVFVWLIGLGQFSGSVLGRADMLTITALAVYAATLGRALVRELYPSAVGEVRRPKGTTAAMRELELGLLLLVGLYVLLAATGGSRSFLYPLVYALVSFLLIVHRERWVAVAWIAVTCGLELLLGTSAPVSGAVDLARVGVHITFILFFSAGNLLVLGSLARRLRGQHGRALAEEMARVRQEARDFRLIASQLPLASRAQRSREEEELRMAHGAVHAVHEQLYFTIDVLSASLDLHTCALLWVEAEAAPGKGRKEPKLVIKEMATRSELVRDDPHLDGPGILACIVRDPKPLRLKALGGRRLPPYYAGPEPITDLCAVPLMEGAVVRGFLVADRIGDKPFGDMDQVMLHKAGEHCLRIIEQERAFAAVEREKYEQEQFYAASELLNQALTLEQVYDKTFAALGAIAPWDLVVLAGYEEGRGRHRVHAARMNEQVEDEKHWRDLPAKLSGLSFDDGASLVSMAVKNRHHMPAHGELADSDALVFDASTKLPGAKSLLVLPLVRGDQVLGTVTLASRRQGAYPIRTREILKVIGHQVGVSLQNARMYESMEERATTDGLTGLLNHRCFQERLEHLHELTKRTGGKYSIILTDIDHFKSVNDTYGHPVGDAVLKRVAALFTGRARKVDIVARYGGEEFVIVLPDTDSEGAALFANRLREEIAEQTMTSDHGSFGVTISMGIAEFPADGDERAQLIERADQCLYYCKEHGRNRVTRYAEL